MKNAELKCAEKMQHLFAHNKTKKAKNKTRKKPKANIYALRNIFEKICTKRLHKHAQSVHAASKQTWPTGSGYPESKNKFSVAIF